MNAVSYIAIASCNNDCSGDLILNWEGRRNRVKGGLPFFSSFSCTFVYMRRQPKHPLTKTATIRFTEEELQWIEEAASIHYHSRGEFIREALWIFRNEHCPSSFNE